MLRNLLHICTFLRLEANRGSSLNTDPSREISYYSKEAKKHPIPTLVLRLKKNANMHIADFPWRM